MGGGGEGEDTGVEVAQVLGFPWDENVVSFELFSPFKGCSACIGVELGFSLNSDLLVVVRALV